MKLKLILSPLLIICLLALFGPLSAQSIEKAESYQRNLQILSQSARSLTIEFAVRDWSSERINVNGENLSRIDFDGASVIDEPGMPQIPYHVAVVGMPIDARVSYRILASEHEVEEDTNLLPFPQIKNVEGWPEGEYIFNKEIYDGLQAFPLDLVRLGEPAFFRDQQIIRIQVAGIQYFPAKAQMLKYHRIVLQVEFRGGQIDEQQESQVQSNLEESFYRGALINYDQASKWRKIKTRPSLAKVQNVLNLGTFYKFNIQEEGIYKIDGAFLSSNGINLADINPDKIRLFNNGGKELPRNLNASRPEGLIENAIFVEDGGDGQFDSDDSILFYGIGVEGWEYDPLLKSYSHYINHYGFDNVYWLILDGQQDGQRITQVNSGPQAGNIQEMYQGMKFVEEELSNPLHSGLNWFGRQFATDVVSSSKSFRLELPNAVPEQNVLLKLRMAYLSPKPDERNNPQPPLYHRFNFSMNDNIINNVEFTRHSSTYLVFNSRDYSTEKSNILISGDNNLELLYTPTRGVDVASDGVAYLDWFEMFYAARLSAVEDELTFSVFPDPGMRTYRISNLSNNSVRLFNVTDFSEVKQVINGSFSNGSLTFTDFQQPELANRYIATNPSKYKSIENLERIEITDLRSTDSGAEFIIITHEDFYSEALHLESLRENGNPDNRLMTEVVRISDVYNNFSGGLMDPVAIRDFLKYAYQNWSPSPAYVLLLGDGDYDYKNIISSSDKNWIPTFQTDEFENSMTLQELVSRATDSWFTYISGTDKVMDLAIGRITAQSLMDAENAVNKIIGYETNPVRGNWRNRAIVVGDDELVGAGIPSSQDVVHIEQAETLAEDYIPACFDVEKIYLSEFPKRASASVSGVRKPEAQEKLIKEMNKGALIVNYIGHGNSGLWAHEIVFERADNDRLQNNGKLLFFVAATCDWALFDRPTEQSQAEELLLAENRGAIAILSSTRLVFSYSNFNFNKYYYSNLFKPGGQTNRIGDAFVLARISNNSITNDEKFHIYGDPTLRLAVPKNEAVITSMSPDSIVALSTMEISGEVRKEGQLMSEFNGKALINTFDSKKFVRHIPEAGSAQEYFLTGNSIYRGAVPVQKGKFNAKFIVPKDISYGGSLARISAYVWNDETDGAGYRDNISVSSTSSSLVDVKGPEMKIYFKEHENYSSGDIVNENVTLIIDLADTLSGINIAGEIGHKLTLSIDPDAETCLSELNRFKGISKIDLTDLFQFKEGDHLRGAIEFPINFPEEVDIAGKSVRCLTSDGDDRHTLVVKAWDNSNNSTTGTVEVFVVHEEGLVLEKVMNYPNPFPQNTTFTFISNLDAEVQVKIYTISGKLIRTLPWPKEYKYATSGFNMLDWDGRDQDGDIPANGVYFYKIIARSQGVTGILHKEKIGRLAILR